MPAPFFGTTTTQLPFVLGEPDANTVVRNATQTMLSDSAEVASVFRLAADRLFFFGAFGSPDGGDAGEIGQEAVHNYIFDSVSNLVFAGAEANISGYDYEDDIIQYLNFTPRYFAPELFNTIFTNSASNRIGVATSLTVQNDFAWLNHDDRPEFPPFPDYALKQVQALTDSIITQVVSAEQIQDAENFFSLDDLIDSSASTYDRDDTQSVIKQSVSIKITGPGAVCPIEKTYSPLKGSSDDTTYPDISVTPPTLGKATLTLTYPRITPTTTLVMKNPAFGNSDTITFTKIDRTLRGGERIFFSDSKWGETQVFELLLERVCDPAFDQLLNFLNESIGKEIGLLDWENRQWKGIILGPNTSITEIRSGYRVSLLFQGELV